MFRYLESPGASPMAYNDDELSDYLDYDDMDYGMSPDYGDSSAPVFSIVDTKGTGASGYQGARKPSNRMTDEALRAMRDDYYATTYPKCSAFDTTTFYLLQAEILVSKRRYREALSAALVAERVGGPNKVIYAITMICMYQLSDDERFKQLKQKLVDTGFAGLSETLRKQATGTIEVSNWVPEFLSCLDQMKRKEAR